MSIKIMSMVWDQGPAGSAETMTLLALADFCNDDGECWPSVRTLAKKARMTERGIQKIMLRLVATGWLHIDANAGRKGCNLYRVTPPNKVHPRTSFTPNHVPPPPNTVPNTPEPRSPEPSRTINEPSLFGDKPPKPQKRACQIPEGWVPSDKNISDAEAKGFSAMEIESEADRFRDFHTAKGSTYKWWAAAWRSWLGNARKFASGRMAGSAQSSANGRGHSLASIVAERWRDGQGG